MEDEAEDQREAHDTSLPTVFERGRREIPAQRPIGELSQGSMLGKYRIVRHLGSGGMGWVYEAVHVEINKTVALKVLSANLAEDQRARARFLREALAASRLEHPCVVKITDFGSEGDVPFLVMELLRGEDLAAAIDRQPRGMPFEEAVDIMLPVAAGVFAAHAAGIVHRDLKPRNIFLARNMIGEIEPKVLDFGISKVDGEGTGQTSLTASGALLGTVPYLSPEHVKGGLTDARADQYTLGVVLFECLAGRVPHEGHTPYVLMQSIAEGRFFPLSARRADLPPELEQDILRAMSIDPAARFASVYEFGRTLLRFASARKRVIWAEYFGYSPDEEALAAGSQPPETGGTIMLPSPLSGALPSATHERPGYGGDPRASAAYVQTSQSFGVDTRSSAQPLSVGVGPQPRSHAGLVVAAIFAAIAIAAAFKWRAAADADRSVELQTDPDPKTDRTTDPKTDPTPDETDHPQSAEVTISATGIPANATIRLDGWAAQLPVRVPRGAKQRELTVEAAGFEPAVIPFVPSEDHAFDVRLQPIAPPEPKAPEHVSIQIASDPPGALVWFEGESSPLGKTPFDITLEPSSRTRRLLFRLAGHQTRTHTLVPDRNRTLDIPLVKLAAPAPPVRDRPRNGRPPRTTQEENDEPYEKLE